MVNLNLLRGWQRHKYLDYHLLPSKMNINLKLESGGEPGPEPSHLDVDAGVLTGVSTSRLDTCPLVVKNYSLNLFILQLDDVFFEFIIGLSENHRNQVLGDLQLLMLC